MADTKITDLSPLTAATGDEIPINRAGADGKITVGGIAALSVGRLNAVYIYTSGTMAYTAPANLNYVIVECLGGGGAGAGAGATTGCGGGGGAGGYARKKIAGATVIAASPVTITAGTGGGAPGVTGAAGSAGSSSSFGTLLTACGGAAGATGAAQALGGAGAASTSGDVNVAGGNGGHGLSVAGFHGIGGKGGDSFYGHGGQQVVSASASFVNGIAGVGFGAGGGGGAALSASGVIGGAGTSGIVIVSEYI